MNKEAQELIFEYWQLAQGNKSVQDLYERLIKQLEADLRWARTIPKEKKNEKTD